jgi:hypothetical protein
LSDQIRERTAVEKGDKVWEQERPSSKTIVTKIWIRQKWQEIPYTEEMAWSRYGRYLKRKFRFKQWLWSFEESVGEKGWCPQTPAAICYRPTEEVSHCIAREADTKASPWQITPQHDETTASATKCKRIENRQNR